MGCSCPFYSHEYVTECESAYCNCCSISQHKLGSLIRNEKELSALLETKYNFGKLQSVGYPLSSFLDSNSITYLRRISLKDNRYGIVDSAILSISIS